MIDKWDKGCESNDDTLICRSSDGVLIAILFFLRQLVSVHHQCIVHVS